jgi:hypothetical protein
MTATVPAIVKNSCAADVESPWISRRCSKGTLSRCGDLWCRVKVVGPELRDPLCVDRVFSPRLKHAVKGH